MSRSASPSLPLYRAPSPALRSSTTARTPIPSTNASTSLTATYALLSSHETANRLSTSLSHGLTPADADVRLAKDGPNELPHEDPEPLWLRFIKQFKETLILLLLGSAAISFFMGNLDDAISIAIAVTIVVTVGFVQEYRSEQSLEALSRLVPHSAHLIRGQQSSGSTSTPSSIKSGLESGQVTPPGESPAAFAAAEKASSIVPAAQLVVGDLVLFSTGDRIPADLRITQSADLTIDESNLTGENEPVAKSSVTLESPSATQSTPASTRPSSPFYDGPAAGTVGADVRLNDQKNIAFMGTLVRSGHGRGIVVAAGANTEFGSIHASLQEIESPRTPLQLSMDRLGQELSYMSFAVIGFIMIVGLWQGRKLLEMFQIGVSLAVAAIPEGLPIIVTVTLALGVLRMANQHAIVRRLPSVETLGSVNVVCSDKTGTLTLNHMTVTKVWHTEVDYPVDVNKELISSAPDTAMRTLLRIGNIANNARLSKSRTNSPATASSAAVLSSTLDHGSSDTGQRSRWVGQPTDVAMLDLVDAFGEEDVRERLGERVCETPFSSERKWMGVVINGNPAGEAPSGSTSDVAYLKGALEEVLKRCDSYLTKEGREIILDEPRRKAALDAAEQMAQDGLRVLGFASGPVRDTSKLNPNRRPKTTKGGHKDESPFHGLVFAGIVGMNDPPRKDVDKSIRRLMAGGVKVIMITGDSESTAVAIAKKLGMPVGTSRGPLRPVLRGDELDRMSEDELAQTIPGACIFARTSPDHKLKIVRALQARGDVVAMTGDGVNDAPALKRADIGISMGLLGTDVAKEAADMILTDDDFSTILSAIEEGKGIFYNIQNFLTFQLSTSVAALSLVLLSTFLGFKNPLNAMQILWINILMDGPPAQSLGVEPVDPAVMTRPPRAKEARVLTKQVIRRVLTSATIIMIGTMIVYVTEMSSDGVVTARDTTMTFTCFVLFDMFNALTCRSQGKSILRGEIAPFGNKMFNIAVAGSLAGQLAVIYLPFLQRIFQTEALGFSDLFWLITVASSVFWVDEVRKWLHTRSARGTWGYSFSV